MREITRLRGSARAFFGRCIDGGCGRKGEAVMKKTILSILAVFIAWSVMDFVIHGVILRSSYVATASLWRPMGEMKTSLMYFTVFIASLAFVLIYSLFFSRKGISKGVEVRSIVRVERRGADGVRELFGDAHPVSHGVHLVFRFGGRGDGGRSYHRFDHSGIRDDD